MFGVETREQQVLTSSELHTAHNAAGINGIGFHYVILQNGVVQRGRPLAVQSEILENHDQYSIMVGLPHSGNYISPEQAKSLRMMMKMFYSSYPGGKFIDAHEVDQEIGFNSGINAEALRSVFKRFNFGGSTRSLSTAQIIAAAQEV